MDLIWYNRYSNKKNWKNNTCEEISWYLDMI